MHISELELAGLIDHTLLKPTAVLGDINELCRQAKDFKFAAVCVNPCYVRIARKELAGTTTGVCTVIGFPLGANEPAIKASEAVAAVRAGASEIDVVINIGWLKGGLINQVKRDLEGVVQAARRENKGVVIKAILETCFLSEKEKIEACRLSVASGADFVKTSTGYGRGGATVSDVMLLRQTVNPGIGVKAAGGIRDLSAALSLIKAGANRLGTSSGISIMKELKDRDY